VLIIVLLMPFLKLLQK